MYHSYSFLNFNQTRLLSIADQFKDSKGTCLLYSGGESDSAQTSYLALFPFETLTIHQTTVCHCQGQSVSSFEVENPWDALHLFFQGPDPHDYIFGYLGYEMGGWSDSDKYLPVVSSKSANAYWQRCVFVLKVEHATQLATLIIEAEHAETLDPDKKEWIEQFIQDPLALCKSEIKHFLANPLQRNNIPDRKTVYLDQIAQIKESIRAGDVYQVNLSQEFTFQGEHSPFNLFQKMNGINPAPFSAYFQTDELSIVSSSPERFLKKQGEYLETRPIKGTIARGKTPEEDKVNKLNLLASTKDEAELVMITDLMRNDLGRLSQPGSVETTELKRCESYANVFHLLSVIRSKVDARFSTTDIIRYCFPGGSITGCPKLSAMEKILELERRHRGVYTGSIGYICGGTDFDLNIAIRTLVCQQNTINLQLGGAIVIDSDPEQEYEETLSKGESLFTALFS